MRRKFLLGDEWIYYKIYSGPNKLEEFLIDIILPMANSLYGSKKIKKFFFTRYIDESHHLRIRFLVTDLKFIGDVIILMNESFGKFIEARVISKICVDTYNRELERYGELTIESVETIFSKHSWDCLQAITMSGDDSLRWLLCAQYINTVVDDFGFSLNAKITFFEFCLNNSIINRTFTKSEIVNLDKIFRENRKPLKEYLEQKHILQNEIYPELNDFQFALRNIISITESSVSLSFLLNSVLHMVVNRFFRTKQPINEHIIYYFLKKYYKSQEAQLTRQL
ncbi:MAG: thiopeptide-type bacteriocin biosynthesis protein [Mucilaginibacter sp.]|uniref:thiopeptide-type bacteriocin biosynthesis protein n=1 Tax=Mucilaginibacter sp. TaxID=1882438 RepID=UPI0032677FFE